MAGTASGIGGGEDSIISSPSSFAVPDNRHH
ncbi:hypothetical protein [Escherichia coli]